MIDEKRKQVAQQCKVVAHLAKALAEVYEAKAKNFESEAKGPSKLIDLVGNWSAGHMEALGDMLNGMDAIDEDQDAWTEPIFREAQRLWPQAPTDITKLRET